MTRNHKRLKWILGCAVIACAVLTLSFMSLKGNSVYFYTTDEAMNKAQTLQKSEIRIGGMVKGGSVSWDRRTLRLEFIISNLKGHDISVEHQGSPPDLFKENSGVVVEGRLSSDGTHFAASKLMVKHSEEYRKPDGTHSMDRNLLEKSIFKGENT
jgi:cytochrome c-type biogenesis protein CcmE